jgi:Protein of unknown function (DUF2959)
MRRFGVSMGLGISASILAFAVTTEAQDEGLKLVEGLIKKAGSTAKAVGDAKLQLAKTMLVYNAIFADDAKDRKSLYKKVQGEMDTMEKRRTEIGKAADEMKVEADAVFKSWADSMSAIENPDLRKRSEERLTKTKTRYAEIQAAGQKAQELYAPFLAGLRDQVTYLGHDLNAEAVASLKPDATKVNGNVQELNKQIDETIAVINKNIAALRP